MRILFQLSFQFLFRFCISVAKYNFTVEIRINKNGLQMGRFIEKP